MHYLEWTQRSVAIVTSALWELLRFLARYIIAFDLSIVAWLAEEGGSPAEPCGGTAAEFAFVLDKLFAMQLAVGCVGA